MNKNRLLTLARDLRKTPPRSPRLRSGPEEAGLPKATPKGRRSLFN
jgi:hypothetical protein